MSKNKFVRYAAVLGAVVIIGAAALSAGPTFAAKGGRHGGGQTPPPLSGTCAATPNPVAQYQSVTVTGSGFTANTLLGFSVNGSLGSVFTDANGSFSRSFDAVWPGTNTVN